MTDDRVLRWIVAAGLALRLVLLAFVASDAARYVDVDSVEYLAIAADLGTAYGGDADAGGLQTLGFLRTPGYPLLIAGVHAVTGGSDVAVLAVQVFLSLACAVIAYALGVRIAGRTAGRAAAAVIALDPVSALYSVALLTETVAAVVTAGGLLLAVRGYTSGQRRLVLAAGLVLGLAVLVRPIGAYLPLLLLPALAIAARTGFRRGVALAAVFLAGFAPPVAGWIARNHTVGGVAVISTVEGHNMLFYRAADAVARERGITWAEARTEMEVLLRERAPGATPTELGPIKRDLGLEVLRDHPRGALLSAARGLANATAGPGREQLEVALVGPGRTLPGAIRLPLLGIQTAFALTVALAALLAVVVLRRRRLLRAALPVLVTAVYLVGLSAGPESYARFRVPAVPEPAVLAGVTLAAGISRARSARVRPASPVTGASVPSAPSPSPDP